MFGWFVGSRMVSSQWLEDHCSALSGCATGILPTTLFVIYFSFSREVALLTRDVQQEQISALAL